MGRGTSDCFLREAREGRKDQKPEVKSRAGVTGVRCVIFQGVGPREKRGDPARIHCEARGEKKEGLGRVNISAYPLRGGITE